MSKSILLPTLPKRRPSEADREAYAQQLQGFADLIQDIAKTLPFTVSARGWCYILEAHGLNKGDFPKAEKLIGDCRKSGLLPMDICAQDDSRSFTDPLPDLTRSCPSDYADDLVDNLRRYIATMGQQTSDYHPLNFWDYQSYYVVLVVEKIDLRSLFEPVCAEFHVKIANLKGWSDLNSRAAMMQDFKAHEDEGRTPVLLYCGDHDPVGLLISDTLRKNFQDLSLAVGWTPDNLVINRFGLNADFIESQVFSWVDNLESSTGRDMALSKDRHIVDYIEHHGIRKCEANVLVTRPEAGRELCREALARYIDHAGIEQWRRDTEAQRQRVSEALTSHPLMQRIAAAV